MIRPQEKIIATRAAIYAASVHVILIAIMIVSFEWRVKLPQVAEVELWDSIPAPSVKAVKPAPEWNKIEIECKGARIKVTLNGEKIIDVDQTTVEEIKNKPLKGYVCVQNHGGKVDFRNLRVKELK